MKWTAVSIVAGLCLSGCMAPNAVVGSTDKTTQRAAASNELGGLPNSEAAHTAVQTSVPSAFALNAAAQPFLQSLLKVVEPQRLTLATRLLADPVVSQGLANWERSTSDAQLKVLKQVAAIEGDVMGFQVPPIVSTPGAPPQPGMMAFYQPGDTDIGQVVLYPSIIARGGKYLAISTLVHEMRHAAQYQLVTNSAASTDADTQNLVNAYNGSWSALDAIGTESTLAYGDYVHLNVEYDAFQTGNEVAALVSKGSFDQTGFGFIDTHYDGSGKLTFSLLDLLPQVAADNLVVKVNTAEADAERQRGGSVTRQPYQVVSPRRTTTVRNSRFGR